MTLKVLNTKPYFDDYNADKQFHKILFRPKVPIQARELTQLQSILQEQVSRLGTHIFENKAMVIPGEIKYDNKYDWIKIPKTSLASTKEEIEAYWLNQTISSGGIQAQVVNYLLPNAQNETVLYVKYVKGSTLGTVATFAAGNTVTTGVNSATIPASSVNPEGVVGIGSAAHINEGIYFVRPYLVLAKTQTIILEPFSSSPTARVGLQIVDSFVTPEDDESIKDNAIGYDSYSAPGAHRYKIDLILTSKDLDLNLIPDPDDEDAFIELLRVENGTILSKVDKSAYAELAKTFARRTYDESGDYEVRGFGIETKEFYRENNNNGVYEDKDFFYATTTQADSVARTRFGLTGGAGTLWHLDPNGSGKAMPGATHQNFLDAARSMVVLGVEPGKAYVRGFEIETIGKTFLDFKKARDTAQSTAVGIETQVGNYVLVDNLNGLLDPSANKKITLYDTRLTSDGTPAGSAIGTARCRGIEYSSGTIAANMDAAVFKLFLFDININAGSTFEQVKAVYQDADSSGTTGLPDFSANILLDEFPLTGTVTIDTSGVMTGVNTYFQSKASDALRVGDWIKVYDVVTGVTTPSYHKITAVTTDVNATVTPNPGADIEAKNFTYVYAEVKEINKESLIFQIPNSPVKSIRDESAAIKTQVIVKRLLTATASSTNLAFTLADVNEDFEEFNDINYIITKTGGGGGTAIGKIITKTSGACSSIVQVHSDATVPQTAQLSFSSALFTGSDTFTMIATIRKKGGAASQEKQKVLNSSEIVSTGSGVTNLAEISLGKADIFKLRKITMSANFTVAAGAGDTDVTDRYVLDDGQRDSFYALGRVLLKPSATAPTGRLRIEFDWFSHSNGNKNYFSVNSYSIPYETIPTYSSSESGITYDLKNCLDFRPRMNTAGTDYDSVTGSLAEMPTDNCQADYSYYLNRSDKLSLDSNGNFIVKYGVSAVYPSRPGDSENAMVLYNLDTQAYTFTPKNVILSKIDNRRYTMKDIGQLARRIENIEYYTTLSMLEKDTADLEIRDANGFDRFKNGFIVDSFEGHGIGDVLNTDYKCSIDMLQKEVRPTFSLDNVALQKQDGTSVNVSQYGQLLMLTKSSDVVMVSQNLASERMNINPFAVFTFIGSIGLNPALDEWKDTTTLPALVIQQEGNYAQMEAQANAMGTVWGEWQTNWTGVNVSTQKTRALDYNAGANRANAQHSHRWPVQQTTTTRTTTTLTGVASRTGIRATVIPSYSVQSLGDRVVDVSYIPYMRTRDVTINAKGFKPNTRLYAFFDNIPVSKYVTSGGSYNPANNIETGTALLTDATGACTATFRIPGAIRAGFENTPQEGLLFRTGQRNFKLSDRDNNDEFFRTMGQGTYSATGLMETHQETILSTRNAILGQEVVADAQAVSQTSVAKDTQVKWVDPLAQSFLVTEENGCFVTKIGVFFQGKDANLPITMQIREMVNGYPGNKVLPFGEVIKDAADVLVSDTAQVETVFDFTTPVYLSPQTEYCFVLMANSTAYYAWVGRMGGNIVGTQIPIQEQPYAGVLFKSQNSSTWTADQEADMKFKIYKGQWAADSAGTVILENDTDDKSFVRLLQNHPLQFVSGSNKVRVLHPNHGMPSTVSVQSRVMLSGILPTTSGPDKIFNIPLTELQGTALAITEVDFDSYTVTTTTNANATGFSGGSSVIASQNRQMDAMQSMIGELILPKTSITYGIKTTSGKSPYSTSQVPYVVDSGYIDHIANETIQFTNQKIVCSSYNESNSVIPGGSKTLQMLCSFRTADVNISPVIDVARTSVVTVANRLGMLTVDNSNVTVFDVDTLVAANANVKFTATSNFISVDSDSATIEALRKVSIGKYIEVTGAANAANNTKMIVTNVIYDAGAGSDKLKIYVNKPLVTQTGGTITVKLYRRFVDEIAPSGGSALSKYITRRVVLAQPAIGAYIRLSAYCPPTGRIRMFLKVSPVDQQGRFDDFLYMEVAPDQVVPFSTDQTDYREYKYTVNGLSDYGVISAMVVLEGTNTADVPRCKDLQLIALGT